MFWRYIGILFDDLETYKKGYNTRGYDILRPSWDDTLAWFRAKGYKITFKDINIGTQCAFYHLDIKEGHTFSYFAKKYEKAREGLVMKLIEVHKEFGNNIKRKIKIDNMITKLSEFKRRLSYSM